MSRSEKGPPLVFRPETSGGEKGTSQMLFPEPFTANYFRQWKAQEAHS